MSGAMVPIVLFIIIGIVALPVGLAYSPLGAALARRLTGGKDAPLEAEVEALRAEVDALRGELLDQRSELSAQIEEVNGRVDFTERLLAQSKDRGALPGTEAR